ncbi:MAG: LysR family transcriptional regulator [Mixta calida]|uniref:LysR family transcriptional regulator n=1 Tax=Mixta calida TaxID=665913 RepID=UPI0028A1DEDB|nr:LysR family transcriptional regulator [Mixta calida]MDU3817999.1 LysR family transcriptional regulator [Pantoea sp.]MDU4942432.1 LysR family transcriptional regulator [Mixta calida]MDU5829160.1 LysR family transcriptional regulator [Mixta calida]MDU6414065.1 LysR family transcriptional regulator [Mixta calida]MDU6539129.1 LysR family transcriptional regulator [Mixta calida]
MQSMTNPDGKIAMDINIQKYKAFLKVVELESFTRAAETLFYSQSGISRMINDLEKEWSVTLFERSRTGVRLTSDGIKLLPFAKNVCEEYQKLQAEVDALNGLQSGIIRIGTFSSVATHWLPGILKAFQEDYPNIDFELLLGDYTEIESWIAEGRVDCGFTRLPASSALETIFLENDEYLVVLPEGHALSEYDVIPLASLCQEPFILLEKGKNNEISEIFRAAGLMPRVKFTLWDDYAVMTMVEKNLGVGILPSLILRKIPYSIITRKIDVSPCRKIGLAFRHRKSASRAVQQFIEYLDYRHK